MLAPYNEFLVTPALSQSRTGTNTKLQKLMTEYDYLSKSYDILEEKEKEHLAHIYMSTLEKNPEGVYCEGENQWTYLEIFNNLKQKGNLYEQTLSGFFEGLQAMKDYHIKKFPKIDTSVN